VLPVTIAILVASLAVPGRHGRRQQARAAGPRPQPGDHDARRAPH